MLKRTNLQSNLVVFGIPLLMILSLIVLMKSSFFIPKLSSYILIDLLITIPLVYYLLVRKKRIANKTVITVAFLGLAVASIFLPEENQGLVSQLRMFLVSLVEIFLVTYIVIKGRKAVIKIKAFRDYSLDFFDILQQVCNEVLPKGISNLFAAEVSVIYYGLLNWKKRKLKENEFSYHKEGTANSVILGFLLVVFVEIFATHGMIQGGNKRGSIILAILSTYTALQVIAVLRSLAKRPIFIDVKKQQVVLKFGILAKAIIPFTQINEIQVSTKELTEKSSIKYFSPLGSSVGHNIVLHLKEELIFESFYGFKKQAKSLAVFVDKKNEFKNSIENIINQK